jgi:hypothetical protein
MASVFAYLIHIDPWMALAAIALFAPHLVFVPLLQSAVNRRTYSGATPARHRDDRSRRRRQ